ncbi:MAG: hypothetical protein WA081_19715 [Desulfosalsimonadaceae bacterium]
MQRLKRFIVMHLDGSPVASETTSMVENFALWGAAMRKLLSRPVLMLTTTLLSLCLSATMVKADGGPAGPGWFVEQGSPVTPEEADTYYSSIANPSSESMTPSSATLATPEITALARALKNDPRLI